MRCKCLSVSQLFVCWCVVIKLNPHLEWRHERDGLAGDCLVPGTIETPDSRLQALLRWLHKCVIIWLRPGHGVGRGPVASCDVRNLSVAWISVRGSNMILCTNIVSDLERKIELKTNLREVSQCLEKWAEIIRTAFRIFANQTAQHLWSLHLCTNLMSTNTMFKCPFSVQRRIFNRFLIVKLLVGTGTFYGYCDSDSSCK